MINRNVIGDTGIHAVTTEIERLRSRLDERSTEFEHLKHTQMRDSNENNALKSRFQLLKDANEREKKQLENQMSHLIHSQAGQLATQRLKSQTLQQGLQEELAASQERIAKQVKEIQWLKRALESNAMEKQQPLEQMERMQRALDAFQSQVGRHPLPAISCSSLTLSPSHPLFIFSSPLSVPAQPNPTLSSPTWPSSPPPRHHQTRRNWKPYCTKLRSSDLAMRRSLRSSPSPGAPQDSSETS